MPKLKISIVILTFNSTKFIDLCLRSLFSQDYQNFEAIVVDNNSNDGTAGFIKESYPQVILVENKKNLGTCKARNQAIEIAQGEWILTLDCDVILERDFLSKMAGLINDKDRSIGMFQPKILNMDKQTIYSCGIHLSRLKRFFDIGRGQLNNGQFNVSRYIFGVCSAAAFYKRQALEEIREETGYFDERFFFLVEDVDLSWRAQKRGWKALYCPEAICYHYGNSSSFDKPLRQFLCWRNRRYLLKKLSLNGFKSFIIFLFYDLPRFIFIVLNNSYVRNLYWRRNKYAIF